MIDHLGQVTADESLSIECSLKACVERVRVTMNDKDIINQQRLQQYFRYIDFVERDETEDESLQFFYKNLFGEFVEDIAGARLNDFELTRLEMLNENTS